ncbi:MAG: copper amine oxidase N-terminal domain-containing protein [Bacillota bacterium]
MRKRLAIAAVCLALLLSSFGSVTLALPRGKDVAIDEPSGRYYINGAAEDLINITGLLIDGEGQPVPSSYVILTSSEAIWDICRTDADGRFRLELPGDAPVGRYTVDAITCQAVVTVAPALLNCTPLSLSWSDVGEADLSYRCQGRLAFVPPMYTHIGLQYSDGYPLVYGSLGLDGHFSLAATREMFTRPGRIELVLGHVADGFTPGLTIAEGEIIPGELPLELDRESVLYDIPQTLTVALPKAVLEETCAPSRDGLQWTSYAADADGKPLEEAHPVAVTPAVSIGDAGVKVKYQWPANRLSVAHAGKYQMVLEARCDGLVYYRGTAPFSVKAPSTNRLYGAPSDASVDQGLELRFGADGIYAAYRDRSGYRLAQYYKVSCSGVAMLPEQKIKAGELLLVWPNEAGEIFVSVEAYTDATYRHQVGTYTFTVNAQGGHIHCDRGAVEYADKSTLKLTVMDNNGVPVNNAYIYISKQARDNFTADPKDLYIDPTQVNVRDGLYQIDLAREGASLVRELGAYTIYAVQAGKLVALAPLEVVGANVYQVELDRSAVLAGERTHLVATIIDRQGRAIIAEEVEISYLDDLGELITYRTAFREVEDAAGRPAIRITMLAPETPGPHQITVKNGRGRYIGQATVEAVLPELRCEPTMLTGGVLTKLCLELVNPLTGEFLSDWDLIVSADEFTTLERAGYSGRNMSMSIRRDGKSGNDYLVLPGSVKRQLSLLITADFKAATAASEVPQIKLEAKGLELGSLKVRTADLQLSPQTVTVGSPASVTVRLTDAQGLPLVGYKICCARWVGVTDAEGKAVYETAAMAAEPVEFTASLDSGMLQAMLRPVADRLPPTISYPANVDRPTAVITIRDDARLTRARVDGVELDITAADRVSHQVSLAVGSNRFVVEAEDYSGNTTRREIVITYVPPSVTLRGDDVLRLGGYALVPVGELRALGAEPSWSIPAGTAAVSAAGRRVEMAVGSTIAMVNGSPAMMPVAPVSVRGRIYVPVRFVADNLGWSVLWQPGDVITLTAR